MTIGIQIKSFVAFALFGIILSIFYSLFLKKKTYLCYLYFPALTMLFAYILFSLNGGKVHPYFIIVFLISIIIGRLITSIINKKYHYFKQKIKK